MRAAILDPLFASLSGLQGVGPKLEKLLEKLLGHPQPKILDALLHIPTSVIDRRTRSKIRALQPEQIATVEVTIGHHRPPPKGSKAPYRVEVFDETGKLILQWFRGEKAYLERMLPLDETRFISGKIEFWEGKPRITHPDRIVTAEQLANLPLVEPVYPLTEGLAQGQLRKIISAALSHLPALPEWNHHDVLAKHRLPDFASALRKLHLPDHPEWISPKASPWMRLAYDELLSHQLALGLMRVKMKKLIGRRMQGDGRYTTIIQSTLPFSLTASQANAIKEIQNDLSKPERMVRMLQGDVGSGKTIVALMVMANVAETGKQSALMAPTEILARQHYERILPLAQEAGLCIAILTGREKGRERKKILENIKNGVIQILIGTHALFQPDVEFHDLAFAIVDEQYRFGVYQRLALANKGEAVDVLVMTATPIPRTLLLTWYGDMDVSSLKEKPPGRQPIDTRTISLERLNEVISGLDRALKDGKQAYWICPLVSESEVLDLTAAEERFKMLQSRFGTKVGLIHGKMKGTEKDAAMAAFAAGETRILVATTVVEVGVDVPEATIIVIDHAERFGLSQLHQLRGRVGRGADRSSCLLLFASTIGVTAKARLQVLRETEDGFKIAEEDLRLRGEGDVLGTKQPGLPGFSIFRPEFHGNLMQTAQDDARLILATDPLLTSERGAALRLLLHIFRRTEAVKLLSAG